MKNYTITTKSGFRKDVASTGASSLVEVLEHMKVFGNENWNTARHRYFLALCEKYGVDPRVFGYHPKRTGIRQVGRRKFVPNVVPDEVAE